MIANHHGTYSGGRSSILTSEPRKRAKPSLTGGNRDRSSNASADRASGSVQSHGQTAYSVATAASANAATATATRRRSLASAASTRSSARSPGTAAKNSSPTRRVPVSRPTPIPASRNAAAVSFLNARWIRKRQTMNITSAGTSFVLKKECAQMRGCSRNISSANSATARLPVRRSASSQANEPPARKKPCVSRRRVRQTSALSSSPSRRSANSSGNSNAIP